MENFQQLQVYQLAEKISNEIWFTEKNNKGATDLYSLVEYKVGKDASFERDYIIGKYGAIPFIGNFKELIGELHE